MQAGKIDIKSLLPEELAAALAEMGEKGFRAKQVFAWLGRGVESFDEMTDLSKALRAKLDERFSCIRRRCSESRSPPRTAQ